MSDDFGMPRNRRRRTTRRLARQPIRVPGDNVPRHALHLPADDEDDQDIEGHDAPGDEADRPSSEPLEVHVDVDIESHRPPAAGAEPASGVVQVPPQPAGAAAVAPISVRPPSPSQAPRAGASVRLPPIAAPSDRPRSPDGEDSKTNPQIRLSDIPGRRTSRPPSIRPPANEPDEATRPRIELTEEMAKAAGRVSAEPRDRESVEDVDTNPRISIPPEEPVRQSVVVSRARVISDLPPPAAPVQSASVPAPARESVPSVTQPPSSSPRPRPPSGDIDVIELDVADASHRSGEHEFEALSELAQSPSRALDANGRVSKAPPPPPDAPSKAPLRKPAATVQAPPPPQASVSAKAPPPPPPVSVAPKKPAARAQPRRRQWWDDFFSDDYLQSVPRTAAEHVSRQVDFIEASLGLPKGAALLDVGCGLGQHSIELARRGYLVVGLDLSLPMITRAAEAAQLEGLRVSFLHGDLRDIGFQAMFDGIVCVGTSFGFFDDEANRDALTRLAAALRPGGKILLDVVNRDYVIRAQPNLVWFEGVGCVVMEESDFNFFNSRLVVKRTMMREDGRQSDVEYSIRLYSLHELGQMLQQVGFRVSEVSGQEATRGIFFGSESARIILVAERRGQKGASGAGAGGASEEPQTGELPRPPA